MASLNKIYLKSAKKLLDSFDKTNAVGFKMRFAPPWYLHWWYRRSLFPLFARYRVMVLMLVRQDLLRWALSIYHGDGQGQPGALQFKLTYGRISRDDIGVVEVDCKRLAEIIARCGRRLAYRRLLISHLERGGVDVHVLRYEDFVSDRTAYMRNLCTQLELVTSNSEIETALAEGPFSRKSMRMTSRLLSLITKKFYSVSGIVTRLGESAT